MFETEDFKKELESAISNEAASSGFTRYQNQVVTYLQSLAAANERSLMDSEMKKAIGIRRGRADALASARALVREAAQQAQTRKEDRGTLQLADMEKAHKAKFCRVWPFCRE